MLLPGKSHGWRSLVGCSPWGHQKSDMTERLRFHFSLLCIGEGNGNPLQCSCLKNPRDGVAQSRTRLKWLSSSSSSSRPACWWLEPRERTLRQPDRGCELTKGKSSPVVSKPAQVMEWVPSLSLPNFRSFSWYLSWTKSNGSPRTEGLNIAHPSQVPESQAMCSKEGWGEYT